jgi:hypothetical protein
MIDWVTVSSTATAIGTLVLAAATYASVRSANRSTRLTELALQEQLQPVLMHSHMDDPAQKIMFIDNHWLHVPGGGAAAETAEGNIYLALSLRNVGSGIAVLHGWHPWPDFHSAKEGHPPVENFRGHARDLYIPAGGVGLWQGALRDASEEIYAQISVAIAERRRFVVDLLYGDHTGGQRTISRFSITPGTEERWHGAVARHWTLDRPNPR